MFIPDKTNIVSDFSVDGIYYKITSAQAPFTVELVTIDYDKSCGNVIIPEAVNYENTTYTVTSIAKSAFLSGMASVSIPQGINNIGDYAFYGCSNLSNIKCEVTTPPTVGASTFDSYRAKLEVVDGCGLLYNGAEYWNKFYNEQFLVDGIYYGLLSETEVCVISNNVSMYSGDITIPESITIEGNTLKVIGIGENAFMGCSGLISIEIPAGVTSIGNYAFCGCSGLTSIEIPAGVTSIGNYAFMGCSGLTSIEIPAGVTSIGDYAFYSCSGLNGRLDLLESIKILENMHLIIRLIKNVIY